jgi:uncharacterized protein (TIGR02996 family)
MSMRTFEYSEGTAHKFWNIEVRDNTYYVTFGKVGSKGQMQRKQFPDQAQAQAAADKLVQQKLAEGFRETTAGAAPPAGTEPPSLAQALEAAIIDHPEEPANHAAYADYLQEQGDPRGEFIQVQLALEDPGLKAAQRKKLQKREQELLKAHEKEWVGDWVKLAQGGDFRDDSQEKFATPAAGFVRGILTQVTIEELTVACARALVAAPQTRLVRELRIGECAYEEEGDYERGRDIPEDCDDPSQYVLLRWPHLANLRVFQLGWTAKEEYGGGYCPHNCPTDGEYAYHFVRQMPRLEELYLFAHNVDGNKLFALPLPNLRVLQLYHSEKYGLAKLAQNASLTRLTHLLCHPHALEPDDEHAYIRLADLRAIVNSPHLPNLKHLRLRLADFGDKGCEEIVKSGILRRLETLDLRHGCVGDAGARTLAASPDLKRLRHLDLSRNELTDQGIAALKAVGISVATEHQHAPGGDAVEDGEGYLYEGDIE